MSSNIVTFPDICSTRGSFTMRRISSDARTPRISELLRCNDVPSDSELSEFRDIIQQGPGRIANLDQKIAHTKELLEALINHRNVVEANIEDAKVLSSPVRRLPPDVLRSIALETIPSPSEIMSIIMTIVGSPELWSSVLLKITYRPNAPLSSFCRPLFLLVLHLERSRNVPLTFRLLNTTRTAEHPFLSLISARASSIKNLYLPSNPDCSLEGLACSRGSWNSLHHLKIGLASDTRIERIFDSFEYAPNLRVLEASAKKPEEILLIPWVQLTQLSLRASNALDLEVLRRAKNIKSLEIIGERDFRMSLSEGYEAISLPFLTSLTLWLEAVSMDFLSFFIPSLTDLFLIYALMVEKPLFSRLNTPNVITTLKLTRSQLDFVSTEPCAFPGLSSLLNSVPHLRHLVIASGKALSSDDICTLIPSPAQTPLPRLKTLDLRGCKFEFHHSELVDMVNIRRQENNPDIDRLETIYLSAPLSLNGLYRRLWKSLRDGGLKVVYGNL
ncbi:uncharacterized protein EV420DRAFT_1689161 [Desarmillaria tabescens]|uniref:F-box domain-containing protein n=1 Tax=Armillaria tabescens TaxID=1929756 RepID=A0AA39N489_ARMTA|nr:uncharacterized protein EV420DRAFT_1689161 [Desarmillaria tabescens]KAK0457606.1 hypothetical protein EV420DRAFT_1689161 [Desarmillaria tabescens]